MQKKKPSKGVQRKKNEGRGRGGLGRIKLGWKRFSIDEKFFWFIHEI